MSDLESSKNMDVSRNIKNGNEEFRGGFFHCMKGNIAQINWSYGVHALSDQVDTWRHIFYYATLQTNSRNPRTTLAIDPRKGERHLQYPLGQDMKRPW